LPPTSSLASRLYPYDWLVAGFCLLLITLALALGRPLVDYTAQLALYGSVILLIVVIVQFADARAGGVQGFLRLLYPVLLFGLFYRSMGGMVFLFSDGFFDWQLTTFEHMILGVNPTLYIDQHLLSVRLNELFSLCYLSYYLMVPGLFIVLYVRKEYDFIRRALTAICLAFFLSYVMFILYPIEGPRFHFANEFIHDVAGPLFRPLTEFVITNGAFHGGCMPSSHVAVALVVMFYGFRLSRAAGLALLPVTVGLAIGTVWGRYHYVSDVVAGAAIGVLAYVLVLKYYDAWSGAGGREPARTETRTEYVT